MNPETEDPRPPIERVEQQARVERFPRVVTEAAGGDVAYVARENITRWMNEFQIAAKDLARMAGVSPEALAGVLKAKSYAPAHADVLRKAEAAIAEWFNRRTMPDGRRFVTTRVAKEVFAVVRLTSQHQGIGVVTGPSGIGKTTALQAVKRLDFPSAILLEVNAGCCSPHSFLLAAFQAERMSSARLPARRGTPSGFKGGLIADAFNRLADKLTGSGRLILVDEADGLKADTFNIIRQLHDATGCPIVLAGRPPLHARIARTMRDERVGGSLVGRICVEHSITPEGVTGTDPGARWLFSVEEVVAMLNQYKVTYSPDAARWLCALANVSAIEGQREGGALRFALKVFEMALTIRAGREVTVNLLKEANSLLRGANWGRRADQIIQSFVSQARVTG
jgi:energy-coupling factor transporter ATP-binding protein EcfA2